MIHEIDDQQSHSSSAVITTLSQAKATLEQLKTLLEAKLLSRVNGSSRIRRRTWARNRSKVYKLQSSLKEHRASLLIAIAANGL